MGMSQRRTLWTLYAVNFLNSIGTWFFLPLLPIFIGRKGGSAALVGVVFAAGLLANAVVRYPAGWAADRFGAKFVLVAAMLASAFLFLAYILPLPTGAFIAIRLLQGCAQGSYWPAANGLLAEVTPSAQRGKAFGYMQSTNLGGMIVGPGIGGLIALVNFNVVFTVAAALSALTVIFLAALPNVRAAVTVEVPTHPLRVMRRLLPLILLGVGTSYMIGAYDTIWSLYMTYRGANTFAVGLSFMAFAVPAMFASGIAGTLSDRLGARRFIVGALVATAFFAALYPFLTSVPWLIALGLLEGLASVSGMPSLMAEVSRVSEPGEYARTQGVYQTVQTGLQIVGALAGGALFTVSPTYAFLAITVICLLSAGTAFVPRRSTRQASEATSY